MITNQSSLNRAASNVSGETFSDELLQFIELNWFDSRVLSAAFKEIYERSSRVTANAIRGVSDQLHSRAKLNSWEFACVLSEFAAIAALEKFYQGYAEGFAYQSARNEPEHRI